MLYPLSYGGSGLSRHHLSFSAPLKFFGRERRGEMHADLPAWWPGRPSQPIEPLSANDQELRLV